jgi:conjugal transfer mating pair stabilization protein TraN
MDAVTVPSFCNHERQDFTCKIADAVYQTVQNCGTQQFCGNGSCWDTAYPPDGDFARTVAYLEAQREAGWGPTSEQHLLRSKLCRARRAC